MILYCEPASTSSCHTDVMPTYYPTLNFISHVPFQKSVKRARHGRTFRHASGVTGSCQMNLNMTIYFLTPLSQTQTQI